MIDPEQRATLRHVIVTLCRRRRGCRLRHAFPNTPRLPVSAHGTPSATYAQHVYVNATPCSVVLLAPSCRLPPEYAIPERRAPRDAEYRHRYDTTYAARVLALPDTHALLFAMPPKPHHQR